MKKEKLHPETPLEAFLARTAVIVLWGIALVFSPVLLVLSWLRNKEEVI